MACMHLMQLGDLNRFKVKFTQQLAATESQEKDCEAAIEKAQSDAQMFYNRAKTVFPHEGKVYHLLASLSSQENDYLAAVYCAM